MCRLQERHKVKKHGLHGCQFNGLLLGSGAHRQLGMHRRPTCSCKLATCRLALNVSAYDITSVHRSSAVQAWLACDTDRE